ncbi:GNAT family N-acetyltransferase [Photobacterium lutimaris]|uniref:GNAT family N-acetyltransferase n=1 Tax=Photobacterium lutimaris TaxID=388278 RepID=A0A2T3J3F0_9GAMM|nr:GNAT family N-acetyltransferase [Photobacterium lutimaris]PSU35814.1 GNAT family N-acetyltransferase [Photobacterium lutimaris]TDR78885.1 putative acetyltransferase [Photobacterium lutimaris]
MKLVSPCREYALAFQRFYNDFATNDPENAQYYLGGKKNFERYVKSLIDESNGVNLRDGYVPCHHYWLVNIDDEIIGAIRVRHNINTPFLSLEAGHIGYDVAPSFRRQGYGKTMLRLVLPKAYQLGIQRALITADEDNIASRTVIERNGGQFDKIIQGKVFPNPIARYWVDCCGYCC